VPVVPLLVAPFALALATWRSLAFRAVTGALLLLSWSIAHLLMDVPRLRYNLPTGRSEMLAYLGSVWGRDLTALLPSFVLPAPAGYAWAAVATFLIWLLYRALTGEREHPRPRPRPGPPLSPAAGRIAAYPGVNPTSPPR
jgi:hypothetical protein